ncbi:MAG TPA: DinB family protein [Gemmatimonadaceae bacterium]|nr:DinB family protein [Gemmatimonadaceae bacterium]
MDDYLSTPNILARLQAEREGLVLRLSGIPTASRNRRPSPNRWSVAEVLEHLVRLETGLTKLLTLRGQQPPAPETPAPGESSRMTPALGRLVRDRSKHIEAPERVLPAGAMTADEALPQLQSARGGMLAAFATANADALDQLTHPHPVFGPLTLRSWVALAADHEARHAEQISEIAEQLSTG